MRYFVVIFLFFSSVANAQYYFNENCKNAYIHISQLKLEKGTHRVELSNHSDHISMQKLVFVNSATKTPQDDGVVFRDVFYDGFDGCDRGNFDQWQQFGGKWEIVDPLNKGCLTENALKGSGEGMIIYDKQNFEIELR